MFDLWSLTKRHMLRYLKDRTAVFFSFLSVLILLVLYILFIGRSYTSGLPDMFPEKLKTFLVVSLTMGGVLVINSMSLSLGIMGTFVEDIGKRNIDAFLVTPIKRWKVIISYYLSTIIVTSILSLMMWSLTILYVGIASGYWYSISVILRASGLLVLYTLISTSIMIFLVTLIKSINAFGALSGILGTLVGFTSGIYMPLEVLGNGVKQAASINPFTHMSVLLKQVLLEEPLAITQPLFSGYEASYEQMLIMYGTVNNGIFGIDINMLWIFLGIGLLSIILLVLAFRNMNQKIKS